MAGAPKTRVRLSSVSAPTFSNTTFAIGEPSFAAPWNSIVAW
jgi:hypothetical protein